MSRQNRVSNEFPRREIRVRTRALLTLSFIVILTVASFSASRASHIMGTIMGISPDSITLETTGNSPTTVTISVTPSTKFLNARGGGASIGDLSVGVRVDVNATTKAHRLEAVTVIIHEQPARHTDRPTLRATPWSIAA